MAIKGLYPFAEKWSRHGAVWIYSDPHFGDSDQKYMDINWPSDEEQIKRINSKVGKKDTLIILGDCGDRGNAPWETIKAVANNTQFIYLKGNHEDMLVGAMLEYLNDSRVHKFYQKYNNQSLQTLLAHNGGSETLQGWIDDGANPEWIDKLFNLPTIAITENNKNNIIIMTHAGYSPTKDGDIPSENDLLWDREHFIIPWPENEEKLFIVHGHTPCPYLVSTWNTDDGSVCYADGHKYDIDMGSYATNTACLLDLDTFDEHIFTTERE